MCVQQGDRVCVCVGLRVVCLVGGRGGGVCA